MKEPKVINAVIGPRVDNVFDKEYIIAAANHYSNGDGKRLPFHSCYGIKEGFVIAGFRHPLAIQVSEAWKEKGYKCVSHGFITSYGRYVDREEAYKIAKDVGQINSEEIHRECLISEDVFNHQTYFASVE